MDGYSRSNFTGQVEHIAGNMVYTIETENGQTWLRISIHEDTPRKTILELQYIVEHLREFILAITKHAESGQTDGIFVEED